MQIFASKILQKIPISYRQIRSDVDAVVFLHFVDCLRLPLLVQYFSGPFPVPDGCRLLEQCAHCHKAMDQNFHI